MWTFRLDATYIDPTSGELHEVYWDEDENGLLRLPREQDRAIELIVHQLVDAINGLVLLGLTEFMRHRLMERYPELRDPYVAEYEEP